MSGTKICPYCQNEINLYALKCQFCGEWQKDEQAQSRTGDTLMQVRTSLSGKYEVLEEVGRGGMAVVYKARQLSLNRMVALKVVHQNLVHDKEFLSRFHREAQLSASLDHPNIVTIYDTGNEGMVHYVAMEYLQGDTLQHIIKRKGNLAIQETMDYLVPISDALDYAHKRDIIHRDIKSSNIFITQSGRSVLMDFGIAHAASQTRLTMTSSILGTPEYMSPEQAEGIKVDHRTDVYSLGVVLYEALTGHVPFKGDNPLSIIGHVKQTAPPPPTRINKKIPAWLESLLLKTLEKKPQDRIQTAGAFSESARNQETVSKKKGGNLIGLKIMAALIILVMISTLFYYFAPQMQSQIKGLVRSATSVISFPNKNNLANKAQQAYNNDQWLKPEQENALYFANLLLKEDPDNSRAREMKKSMYEQYMAQGEQAFEERKLQTALTSYKNAFTVYPARKRARKEVASEYLKAGEKNLKALKIGPTVDHYRAGLSIASREPTLTQIESQLQKSLEQAQALSNHLTQAHQHYQKGAFDKAVRAYQKALQLERGKKQIQKLRSQALRINRYVNAGNRAMAANRCQEAIASFQKALNADPENQLLKRKLQKARNCFSIGLEMVYVSGGSFQMGCRNEQAGCDTDEKPAHRVRLKGFYIGKYEVTNSQYCHFLNERGNQEIAGSPCIDISDSKIHQQGGKYIPRKGYDNYPVSGVTWHGARAFCRWLSQKSGKSYRLPTEAEWEYAARGGQQSKHYIYSGSNNAREVAWFDSDSMHPAGKKKPNELGIYDMSGNLSEWCYDRYDNEYYGNSRDFNPRNASKGKARVLRGGNWAKDSQECRNANRTSLRPEYSYEIYGFRICSN